jgi:energy-converting hydrogenase Eha subunit C
MPRLDASTTGEDFTRDDYVFLRQEMRHEDDLINARLSWLINSQSFLFGAFAITLNGSPSSKITMYAKLNVVLVNWLPVAGILSVAVSYLTILAAILHMRRVRRLARGKHPPNLLPLQGEIFIGRMGLSGAVVTPLIFLSVWFAIILEAWSGK